MNIRINLSRSSFSPALRVGLLIGCVLFVGAESTLGQSAPEGSSPPPLTAKKASGKLKKAIAGHLKYQKGEYSDIMEEFCEQVDLLTDILKEGAFKVDEVMEAMINEMGVALRDINDVHNDVVNQTNFDAEQLLVQLDSSQGFPDAFIMGECDTLDKGLAKAGKAAEIAVKKMRAKLKAFNKKAMKAAELATIGHVDTPDPVSIAPNPDHPAGPPVKDLKAGATFSSSEGNVCLTGTYSGDSGVSVDVTVMVGGMPFTLGATTSGCTWQVCFSDGSGLDAPLDPGNYSFEIREFDVDGTLDSICTSAGVP